MRYHLKNGELTFLSLSIQDKKKDKVSAEEISGPLTIGGGAGIGKAYSKCPSTVVVAIVSLGGAM